jgi:hypothetical protein
MPGIKLEGAPPLAPCEDDGWLFAPNEGFICA